jgi:hypothetical protein
VMLTPEADTSPNARPLPNCGREARRWSVP